MKSKMVDLLDNEKMIDKGQQKWEEEGGRSIMGIKLELGEEFLECYFTAQSLEITVMYCVLQ